MKTNLRLILTLACLLLFGTAGFAENVSNCPANASAAVPFVKKYVENSLKNHGRIRGIKTVGVPELRLPQLNYFSKGLPDELKKDDFARFGKDDISIGEGVFSAETRFIVRPGEIERLFVPILGLTFKTSKHILMYVCVNWDEEDLDNSSVRIFFLRTNYYRLVDVPRHDVIVEPYQAPIYLHTISGLIGVVEDISLRIFKRPLIVAKIVKLVRKIESAFYYLQTEFLRVGVSEIEMSQDIMTIRGAVGVLLKQFNILKVRKDLADDWWREYLRNGPIFEQDVQPPRVPEEDPHLFR